MLATIVVAVSFLSSPNFRLGDADRERSPYAGDFLHEWVGGYIVRAGDATRLYDREYAIALEHDWNLVGFRLRADGFLPMVYPPVYYLAISPLSALPYHGAAWVWAGLSLASFAVVVLLLSKAFSAGGSLAAVVRVTNPAWDRVAPLASLVALPAAVAFVPFAENLVSSQKGTFWLLIFASTFFALRRGWRWSAGMLFGLQALKPQFAIVVPIVLAIKGEWRFALGATITMALLVGASLLVGSAVAADYLRFAGDAPQFVRYGTTYAHRSHGAYAFFSLLAGEPTTLVRVATVITIVVTGACLAWLFRGAVQASHPRFITQFAGLVLATVIVSPHVLTYDLTILLLPMALLAFLALRSGLDQPGNRAMFWLTVALYVMCGIAPSLAQRTGIQLTLPLLLALLVVLSRRPLTAGG